MLDEARKLLFNPFISLLAEDFGRHCERHGLEAPNRWPITFLTGQNLSPKKGFQLHVVEREFEKLVSGEVSNKTYTIGILARRSNLVECPVWKILIYRR